MNLFKPGKHDNGREKEIWRAAKAVKREPVKQDDFFFANVKGIERPEPANNPYDNWARQAVFENKAICMYLGIEYNEDDFTTSSEALARSWVQDLPDKE